MNLLLKGEAELLGPEAEAAAASSRLALDGCTTAEKDGEDVSWWA